jgi:uracil-DNA glycosylase family 4
MNQDQLLRAAKRAKNPEKRKKYLQKWKAGRLRLRIQSCEGCALAESRLNAVPWSGPTPSELAILGEAPGAQEDKEGSPFVGKSGELLNSALEVAGLDRKKIFVFNSVCCRPPGNRNPKPEEQEACRPWYEKQLRAANPLVVILAGNAALNAGLGETGITSKRGKPVWKDGYLWFPVKHPAWYLRRGNADELADDLTRVKDILEGYSKLPFDDVPDLSERSVGNQIRRNGWAHIHSDIIGDHLVVKRSEETVVPIGVGDYPQYTLDELARVRMLAGQKVMNTRGLRVVHEAKKVFNGTIVR